MKSPRYKKLEKAHKQMWNHNADKRIYPSGYIDEDSPGIIKLVKDLKEVAKTNYEQYLKQLKMLADAVREKTGKKCVIGFHEAERYETKEEIVYIAFYEGTQATAYNFYSAYFDTERNLPYLILGDERSI